ncbi:MAG: DUF933 domain-containing protein [bacterium]
MKIVITGSPQAGQQELFSVLTGIPLETFQQKSQEAHPGVCPVKDPRITKLIEMYKPKKTAYARIEYLLLPDLSAQGPTKVMLIKQLKNSDELCFVCRGETAADDVAGFLSELIINDLMFVEKRLENIAKGQKAKFAEQAEKEKVVIEKCLAHLEGEKPLSQFAFTADDKELIQNYQFLSLKPIIFVINVSEDQIKDNSLSEKITATYSYPAIQVCAELEQEISQLDEADRASFMKEMGIEESALDKMNRQAFDSLGLISFFTVGEDEVRAWPVEQGASAPKAGSVIHSDIEKGFVRAELFTYDELMAAGSEAKLKELGKFQLKGRDYIVQDGDILNFRFNV